MKTGAGQSSVMKKLFLCLAFALVLTNCSLQTPDLEQYVFRGATMGTSYNIKIVVPKNDSTNTTKLHADIKFLLNYVNSVASTYLDDSELSRFNHDAANRWMAASPDLVGLVDVSMQISRLSGGAFDITVGPLVNLWGFGPEHNPVDVPSEKEIARRKKLVGYEYLQVRYDPPSLRKNIDSLYCDLSAIAKGWGVDKVAELLESQSFENYLVEIGGEIRAKGTNVKGSAWRIGVSSPRGAGGIDKVINVTNIGVATSGDYRNYFEKDGVRYSHTIDPRSGAPIQHELASVTVIHPSCMMADAFATAIDVLGPEDGLKLARENNLALFMILKSKEGFEEKMTPSFEQYIAQ